MCTALRSVVAILLAFAVACFCTVDAISLSAVSSSSETSFWFLSNGTVLRASDETSVFDPLFQTSPNVLQTATFVDRDRSNVIRAIYSTDDSCFYAVQWNTSDSEPTATKMFCEAADRKMWSFMIHYGSRSMFVLEYVPLTDTIELVSYLIDAPYSMQRRVARLACPSTDCANASVIAGDDGTGVSESGSVFVRLDSSVIRVDVDPLRSDVQTSTLTWAAPSIDVRCTAASILGNLLAIATTGTTSKVFVYNLQSYQRVSDSLSLPWSVASFEALLFWNATLVIGVDRTCGTVYAANGTDDQAKWSRLEDLSEQLSYRHRGVNLGRAAWGASNTLLVSSRHIFAYSLTNQAPTLSYLLASDTTELGCVLEDVSVVPLSNGQAIVATCENVLFQFGTSKAQDSEIVYAPLTRGVELEGVLSINGLSATLDSSRLQTTYWMVAVDREPHCPIEPVSSAWPRIASYRGAVSGIGSQYHSLYRGAPGIYDTTQISWTRMYVTRSALVGPTALVNAMFNVVCFSESSTVYITCIDGRSGAKIVRYHVKKIAELGGLVSDLEWSSTDMLMLVVSERASIAVGLEWIGVRNGGFRETFYASYADAPKRVKANARGFDILPGGAQIYVQRLSTTNSTPEFSWTVVPSKASSRSLAVQLQFTATTSTAELASIMSGDSMHIYQMPPILTIPARTTAAPVTATASASTTALDTTTAAADTSSNSMVESQSPRLTLASDLETVPPSSHIPGWMDLRMVDWIIICVVIGGIVMVFVFASLAYAVYRRERERKQRLNSRFKRTASFEQPRGSNIFTHRPRRSRLPYSMEADSDNSSSSSGISSLPASLMSTISVTWNRQMSWFSDILNRPKQSTPTAQSAIDSPPSSSFSLDDGCDALPSPRGGLVSIPLPLHNIRSSTSGSPGLSPRPSPKPSSPSANTPRVAAPSVATLFIDKRSLNQLQQQSTSPPSASSPHVGRSRAVSDAIAMSEIRLTPREDAATKKTES